MVEFRQISLHEYPKQPIEDFAAACNYFIDRNDWTLFVADDEEPSQMLLRHLNTLVPDKPYYAVRVIMLKDGRFTPGMNPFFGARLVSNKGPRFYNSKGKVHEHIKPRKPFGLIDYPIIHNHVGPTRYKNPWYFDHPLYRAWLVGKKLMEVARGY